MLNKFKLYIDTKLERIFVNFPKFSPNVITTIGLIPPLLFLFFLKNGEYWYALLSLILTTLDTLDGSYARATNQTSKFGALLDSSFDRISDTLIISAFGFTQLISWEIVIILIIFSVLISYVRARGESLIEDAKKLAIGPIERSQRISIIFLALLLFTLFKENAFIYENILELSFWLLIILSLVTVIRRLMVVYKKKA